MRIVRLAIDSAREARDLGAPYAVRRRLPMRNGECRVRVRGVGPVVIRRGTSDATVFSQVFSERQYDLHWFPQNAALIRRYGAILASGKQPLIIDAGANNGASALWFAQQYPDALIVAVEPEASNADVCRRNTSTAHVETVEAAIGSTPGHVTVHSDGEATWSTTTTRTSDDGTPIVTIAGIVEAHRPSCELFIVKIDIEGFESDLFATNTEWIAAATAVILEPHDGKFPGARTSRSFQRALSSDDFDLLISGENLVYVRSDEPAESAEREPSVAGG